MPYIIVIDKNCTIKEINIKEYKENELFKKANFKSPEGFLQQTKWEIIIDKTKYNISVYGKTNGKAGQENKYEFPPPIDSVLFFGGCVLTNVNKDGSILDLHSKEWHLIYDKLMGGFDNIDENVDEDEDEDEDDIESGKKLSKDGYICDDFVVDDGEVDYDNLSLEEDDEIEEEIPKSKIKNNLKKKSVQYNSKKKTNILHELKIETDFDKTLDFQSELHEEEYV